VFQLKTPDRGGGLDVGVDSETAELLYSGLREIAHESNIGTT
jgi:hypothetical protein